MNLYIETENGQTKNHPAYEDNLMQAFGEIPSQWEPFNRVERPVLGMYQVLVSDTSVYEKVNGVWTDVWTVREMTADEKSAKQQLAKSFFNTRFQAENWAAWVLDEATCTMVPPIPRPARIEGVDIRWCGADNNWKEVPVRPVDDNQYKFDFLAWQWIQVVD